MQAADVKSELGAGLLSARLKLDQCYSEACANMERNGWRGASQVVMDIEAARQSVREAISAKTRFKYTIGRYLDWVIVGGESGADRRECEVGWITAVVDQCRESKTPIFVKQDSGPKSGMQGRIPNDYWVHEFPISQPHRTQTLENSISSSRRF